jgi:DNA-binding MarR family transcriptional regulator
LGAIQIATWTTPGAVKAPRLETPMPPGTLNTLRPEPPPTIKEALLKRFSGWNLAAVGVTFELRMAAQQFDNTLTEWMADTAGSVARFQILSLLWASGGEGVPHKDIVKALAVTRATVSGLMAALERDRLVKSAVDRADRRNLIATLTPRGRAIVEQAIESNIASLSAALASLSTEELATLTSLLQRFRNGLIAIREKPGAR